MIFGSHAKDRSVAFGAGLATTRVERSPDFGGFVCSAESSPEWIRLVNDVWLNYYKFGVSYVGFEAIGSCKVDEMGAVVCGTCGGSAVVGSKVGVARLGDVTGQLVASGGSVDGDDVVRQSVGECVSEGHDVVEGHKVGLDGNTSSGVVVGSPTTAGSLGSFEGFSADSCRKVDVVESDVSYVSEKTLLNRRRREKKKNRKLRKQNSGVLNTQSIQEGLAGAVPEWRRFARSNVHGYRGAFETCDDSVRKELASTRADRLIAENKACALRAKAESERWSETVRLQRKRDNLQMLKVGKEIEALRSSGVESIQEDLEQRRLSQQLKIAQSRQKLELVAAQDVESLKRRQASKVLRDTETNKVAVERAFGTLAGTGNVPSLVGGKVHTIKSGSISPNSSASEAEVRAIQKENLDLRKQVEELSAKLRTDTGERQDYDGYDYSEGVTIDEDGHPIGDFGDYSGYIGRDNRFHFGESMMPYFD